MKRFLYLLCALAFCLALTPATALAADEDAPDTLLVGGTNVKGGGYWTTTSGTLASSDVNTWNVHYDTSTNTLTLKDADITGAASDETLSLYVGIYAYSSSGDVSLNIELQGENTITSDGNGIYVYSPENGGSASLTITGEDSGSLDANCKDSAIIVQRNSGNASLSIKNAEVEATVSSASGNGVLVRAAESSSASLSVDGGNLTATGTGFGSGINFQFGDSVSGSGTPSLTVSENAMVKASGGEGGISTNSSTATEIKSDSEATSGGIVFNGNEGTVYGSVTLDESLTVNEGETLTIPEGSTLNGDITVANGGKLNGTPTGGTVVHAPGITEQPQNQTVDEGETATFTITATGDPLTYQWQQSTDGADWTDISGANSDTYTTEAATTDMNGRQYRCKVSNSAGSVTSEPAILTVNQHEHEWGEPAWTWDGTTATATFTCKNDASHTQTVTAAVTSTVKTDPTCTEDGVTEYTATVEHDGTTYTATKNVADIPATGHDWGEDGHCTICDAVKPGFTPEIIQGDEATWTKGDGQPLSFTSNAAYADFQEARVDGQTLDPVHYTVEQGSTIVTLKADYLESLDPGEHTLDIVSATGTATATFTITAKETQQPAKPADTDRTPAKSAGDGGQLSRSGSDIMPAVATLAILMASGLALGTLVLRRGRR